MGGSLTSNQEIDSRPPATSVGAIAKEASMPRNERSGVDDPADEFIQLLLQHKSQLLGYIFCMVRNLPDAEDVFQQMSLTMWDKFGEFVPGTNFMAWAKVVARNKALTFLRSQRRERARFSEDVIDLLSERKLWSPDSAQERIAALVQCRQRLSQVDQDLLSACYGTTSAFREVAERMGRSVDSVYSSLSRIRRALYDCIQRSLAKEQRA
jgi:RNA polymerase sigma-70 factor (ECF subfamily)